LLDRLNVIRQEKVEDVFVELFPKKEVVVKKQNRHVFGLEPVEVIKIACFYLILQVLLELAQEELDENFLADSFLQVNFVENIVHQIAVNRFRVFAVDSQRELLFFVRFQNVDSVLHFIFEKSGNSGERLRKNLLNVCFCVINVLDYLRL
jgi:hypothetical protein